MRSPSSTGPTVNDQVPKIRLLLANTGKNNLLWRPTVERLKTMTGAPDRLRAVSGVATSSTQVKSAVKELTSARIAVVGSTITADDIANGPKGDPFPGLARVSPTNRDEARALARSARCGPTGAAGPGHPHRGPLHGHAEGGVRRAGEGHPVRAAAVHLAKDPTDEGTTADTFQQITHLICDSGAETVSFADTAQLRQFINALGARGCRGEPGVHRTHRRRGLDLGGDKKLNRNTLRRKVTVRYASLAHPDAWAAGKGGAKERTGGSPADYQEFLDLLEVVGKKPVGPMGPTGPPI